MLLIVFSFAEPTSRERAGGSQLHGIFAVGLLICFCTKKADTLIELSKLKNVPIRSIVLIQKFSQGFYFCETSYAKFRENKPSLNGETTLSFTDIGKSGLSREFLTPEICL